MSTTGFINKTITNDSNSVMVLAYPTTIILPFTLSLGFMERHRSCLEKLSSIVPVLLLMVHLILSIYNLCFSPQSFHVKGITFDSSVILPSLHRIPSHWIPFIYFWRSLVMTSLLLITLTASEIPIKVFHLSYFITLHNSVERLPEPGVSCKIYQRTFTSV